MLEDACEALGATDAEGRRAGARGNLAAFGFYANKQLTTGEGGMLIPDGAEVAARLRSERNQGRAPDMGWLDHSGLGFNYRLSDLAAAVGVAQLEKLDAMLTAREGLAARYSAALAAVPGVEAPAPGRGRERRGWFVYPVRLPAGVDRDATIARLAERGVASKAYMPCIHLFPHLRELGYGEGDFPVAEEASRRSLALPFFPQMTDSDVARVCESLADSLL
jgi:perosamine synthetase